MHAQANYQFFPNDILEDSEDNSVCYHAEAFLPDCEDCIEIIRIHLFYSRPHPKPYSPRLIPKCDNHKGRLGKYPIRISGYHTLIAPTRGFERNLNFCVSCYREQLRNEDIPFVDFAGFYLAIDQRVAPSGFSLDVTRDKHKLALVSKWLRLQERPSKIITIEHKLGESVSIKTTCSNCKKLACTCHLDVLLQEI